MPLPVLYGTPLYALHERWSDEETDSPTYADDRNFYKLEKWTKDRTKVDRLLYAATIWKRRASCSPTLSSTGHGSG